MKASPSPRKLKVKEHEARELLLVLARQTPVVLASNVVVAPVCYNVIGVINSDIDLRVWFVGMYVLTAIRWVLLFRFRASALDQPESFKVWSSISVFGSLLSGLFYGFFGYLATDPGHPVSSVFALMLLVGMSSGSIASLAAVPGAYMAFTVPAMAPIIFRNWPMGEAASDAMALFSFIFLFVGFAYTQIQRRTLIESIRLRFEKEELILELDAARQRSDAANDAKTRFLLSAGHDLRQPLYAITLLIEAIGHHLPESAARQTDAMRACAHTIDELLDRMLEVARLDAGKTEARLENAPLQSVFERLLVEFEPEAEKREVVLKCVDSSLILKTDVHLLTCILRNFLSNALRYGAGGRVLMGARRTGGAVRIEVLDQGPGIPPEYMEAIFEPFYQVGNAERAPENGHGLGLAIAKGMANMMGAQITARSQPQNGSAFTITIQAGSGETPIDEPFLVAPQEIDLGAPLILLVEDVRIVRETTSELLRGWGCRVLAAAQGVEALEKVAQSSEPIDCIITDLRLPGDLDGIAVVRALRAKTEAHLPAILTTADPAVGRGQAEGVTVLTKPVAPSRLRQTLAFALCNQSTADQV